MINEIRSAKLTESGRMLSPDDTLAIFVKDHNIWVQETATGKKVHISGSGEIIELNHNQTRAFMNSFKPWDDATHNRDLSGLDVL